MNIELRDIFFDIEVIKEKIDDIVVVHGWFVDEFFRSNTLQNTTEIQNYGLGYKEHRIHNSQMLDLMSMYQKELDEKFKQFKKVLENEKSVLSHTDQSEDNTHK
ncbi:DUF1474 family protein [Staphylococcus arlettae]|uniref:type II toxin-antitoxin system toxin TscT n=1 Tax=Staphylococcus arlettae TaxID=29378 RepID=UPI001E286747|nr:DUF1474 family protein [Staphylococcus arlettae]MCD8887927.1 DUF1474 family protein [Staphylococcus arlettae]